MYDYTNMRRNPFSLLDSMDLPPRNREEPIFIRVSIMTEYYGIVIPSLKQNDSHPHRDSVCPVINGGVHAAGRSCTECRPGSNHTGTDTCNPCGARDNRNPDNDPRIYRNGRGGNLTGAGSSFPATGDFVSHVYKSGL